MIWIALGSPSPARTMFVFAGIPTAASPLERAENASPKRPKLSRATSILIPGVPTYAPATPTNTVYGFPLGSSGSSLVHPDAMRTSFISPVNRASDGSESKSNGVPRNGVSVSHSLFCESASRFHPANFSSILARASRSSSAVFVKPAACRLSAAASRSFLLARSFASPAFRSAIPARSSAPLARSIAEPSAVRVWDDCDSRSPITSSDNWFVRAAANNSRARPRIKIIDDSLPMRSFCSRPALLSGKVPKSEIVSPMTPMITTAVDTYPNHFQNSANLQKLLHSQDRINREEIAYILRQRRGEYINLIVCAAALLILAAIRITRLKRP